MQPNPHQTPPTPYAPPRAAVAEYDALLHAPATDRELALFVGPRADYYLDRWRRLAAGDSHGARTYAGFNGAAFLVGPFWLAYRRLHAALAVFVGIALLPTIASQLAGLGPERARLLSDALALVLATSLGFAANSIYYRSARAAVRHARTARDPQQRLRERGAPSLFAPALLGIAVVLAAVALTTQAR